MAIKLTKAQKINGIDYPAGIAIVGLDAVVEAAAAQGGGAQAVNLAVVDSSVSGAGNALQTYTIAGSSINAYCHPPQYPAVTFADQGNGVVRVSGTKIAKTFRKGMRLRVGGNAVTQYNQFNALITAHDTSSAVGWFEYSYTGAFSPVVTTLS